MSKQDAMQEIETIRARLTVLEKIVQEEEKPQGLWRPGKDALYFSVSSLGDPYSQGFAAYEGNTQKTISHGNCFPTSEAAEKAAPLFARAHKIIQAALMADPDAGASDRNRNWSAYCDIPGHWFAIDGIGYGAPVFVHTKEQSERMAAILNAEGV